jgi:tetratricopeptide (TPR) repeat protein
LSFGRKTPLSEAIALKPDFAEGHNNLGVALQAQGKLEDALAPFNKALHLKPDYAEAHFCTALAVKPEYFEGHYNLGSTLLDLGGVKEGLDELNGDGNCLPTERIDATSVNQSGMELQWP